MLSSNSENSVNNASKTQLLTKAEFIDKVMDYENNPNEWVFKGDLPCIIDFYADWCSPCKRTAPILDELAAKYAGKINIYKIDTQKERELTAVFGVQSLPTFLFCPKSGKPQMSSGIGRTDADTREMFESIIKDFLL